MSVQCYLLHTTLKYKLNIIYSFKIQVYLNKECLFNMIITTDYLTLTKLQNCMGVKLDGKINLSLRLPEEKEIKLQCGYGERFNFNNIMQYT